MGIKIEFILDFLKLSNISYKFSGDAGTELSGCCPLNHLQEKCLTWVRNAADLPVNELNNMNGMAVFAEYDAEIANAQFPVIYVEHVHRTFFKVVERFWGDKDPEQRTPAISNTAVVETEHVGEGVYIGHHTYISRESVIGNHVTILNNVTIEGSVTIGDYTVIESGTTIGACGFGHYTDTDGNPVCVPHIGGVVIGKHVKIGANCAISRGCLSDTIIEDYVKTDNLCHIAHNDHIKYGAMLTAGVVISGSTTVGENVWLAPGTILNNAIHIGDGSYMGLGTVVTKDVQEGKMMVGVPARVLKDRK